MHYLFVCYANAQRSPTAKDVCRKIAKANDFDIEAGSAGISRASNRPLTKGMADKADKIFEMEEDMRIRLVQDYEQNAAKIICLDIPDVYNRDDPILIHILEGKLYEFLAGEGLL
jgi:predicted protein tyrosine phosphatase